jgi:hypothetical protein
VRCGEAGGQGEGIPASSWSTSVWGRRRGRQSRRAASYACLNAYEAAPGAESWVLRRRAGSFCTGRRNHARSIPVRVAARATAASRSAIWVRSPATRARAKSAHLHTSGLRLAARHAHRRLLRGLPFHARAREGARTRGADRCRRLPYLRDPQERQHRVLGRQRRGPAWRRFHRLAEHLSTSSTWVGSRCAV